MAWGLLVKHAGLDDLLIHVEFVFGSCQDFLLHAVHSAETEHAHLILLTYTVSPVLSLKVLESADEREIWDPSSFIHHSQVRSARSEEEIPCLLFDEHTEEMLKQAAVSLSDQTLRHKWDDWTTRTRLPQVLQKSASLFFALQSWGLSWGAQNLNRSCSCSQSKHVHLSDVTDVTWCGFQSLSKMTTVSAACRLRPRPPALVLSRKMKYWDPSSLNFFSSAARSSDLVVPETSKMFLISEQLRLWKQVVGLINNGSTCDASRQHYVCLIKLLSKRRHFAPLVFQSAPFFKQGEKICLLSLSYTEGTFGLNFISSWKKKKKKQSKGDRLRLFRELVFLLWDPVCLLECGYHTECVWWLLSNNSMQEVTFLLIWKVWINSNDKFEIQYTEDTKESWDWNESEGLVGEYSISLLLGTHKYWCIKCGAILKAA